MRKIPGLEHALAIIVVESNLPFIADDIYERLRRSQLRHHMLLYLTPAAARKRQRADADGVVDPQTGEMNPGVRTTNENKGLMMDWLYKMLHDKRLRQHKDLVTLAGSAEASKEMHLLAKYDFDVAAVRKSLKLDEGDDARPRATVYPTQAARVEATREAIEVAHTAKTRRQMFKEFLWMRRFTWRKKLKDGSEQVTLTFTGKGGKDPEDGADRKDDIVMALGIMLFGACAFYLSENYSRERQRVAL